MSSLRARVHCRILAAVPVAVALSMVVVIGPAARPAAAHATLLSTSPANGELVLAAGLLAAAVRSGRAQRQVALAVAIGGAFLILAADATRADQLLAAESRHLMELVALTLGVAVTQATPRIAPR